MTGRRVRFLFALLAVAFAASHAHAAGEGAGTRAAAFLSSGYTPAQLSMGGAGLALGNDVQGATLNPAALGAIGVGEYALAHASFPDQTSQDWAAWGGRLGKGPVRLGLSAVLRDEGTIDARDAADQPLGAQDARDFALTLQVARPVGSHLVLGAATHVVNQRVATASGTGYTFDAGAQVRFGLASFALAGRNFGGTMNWSGQRWAFPALFSTGVALESPGRTLRAAVDLERPADYFHSLRTGVEWRWRDRFALRTGYRAEQRAVENDRLSGPTFGFGAGAGALWIDYGYVVGGDGDTTHRFALTLHRRPAAAEKRDAAPAAGPTPDPAPAPIGPSR